MNYQDNLDRAQTNADNGNAGAAIALALIDIARTLRGIETWCNLRQHGEHIDH